MKIPTSIIKRVESYSKKLENNPKLCSLYKNAYIQTFSTALKQRCDGTYFVLTGDIPAMWLRDSAAQVHHYVPLAKQEDVAQILEGVLRRQLMYIEIDPYANAFNEEENGAGDNSDFPPRSKWVWERKYEIDSLCYPIRLLYMYWKETGRVDLIRGKLEKVATAFIMM